MNEDEQKIVDEFVSLVERSQQLFNGLRDLPQFGRQWQPYFQRTFEVYTKLWKFQQVNRPVLENKGGYGIKRWEIGEIASKIGQLYYHYYPTEYMQGLRTSETNYLYEAFVFYDAIRTRKYFDAVMEANSAMLMVKKLRYYTRFIVVCLLLDKQKLVSELLAALAGYIDEYSQAFKPQDTDEWAFVLREIHAFLDATSLLQGPDGSTAIVRSHRLVSEDDGSGVGMGEGGSARTVEAGASAQLRLQEAVVVGNQQGKVKFSELTMDMFRMVQALEREPVSVGEGEAHSRHQDRLVQGDRSKHRRSNPHKFLLYNPSFDQLMVFLSSAVKDVAENCAMLVYVSAPGTSREVAPDAAFSPYYARGGVSLRSTVSSTTSQAKLEKNCLYPAELIQLCRKHLMLIVDSDNSVAFMDLPSPFGSALLCLLSPQQTHAETQVYGGLFTLFLHDPLAAFCVVIGTTTLGDDQLRTCMDRLDEFFPILTSIMQNFPDLHPSVALFMQDPFLRQCITRFVFARTVLSLHKEFGRSPAELPQSNPKLPYSLYHHPVIADVIYQLAAECGVVALFNTRTTLAEDAAE